MEKTARVDDVHHRTARADCVNRKPTRHVFFPDVLIGGLFPKARKIRNQHIRKQEPAHPESGFGLL